MSRKTVEFFYDVVSPFSWFGFETICRYQNRWNMNLKLRPFLLGGIMSGTGNQPPAMLPAKGRYLHQDVDRLAKYFNVPIKFPKDPAEMMFVKGTLTPQRFLTVIEMEKPEMLEKVSRELWMRAWSRDEDISEPASVAEAAKKAGMSEADIARLLPKMKDNAVKERLKQTTQDALDLGAFGAPIIAAEINGKKEWVFGSDRFPIFAQMIGEKWEGPEPGVKSKL